MLLKKSFSVTEQKNSRKKGISYPVEEEKRKKEKKKESLEGHSKENLMKQLCAFIKQFFVCDGTVSCTFYF